MIYDLKAGKQKNLLATLARRCMERNMNLFRRIFPGHVAAAAAHIGFRCHAREFLEVHIEIIEIGIAGAFGDLFDAHIGGLEQFLCPLDPHPVDTLDAGLTHIFLKEMAQMIGADIELFGDLAEGKAFTQVIVEIEENVIDLPVAGKLQTHGTVDGIDQLIAAERLQQQFIRAQAKRRLRVFKDTVGRDDNELGSAVLPLGLLDHLKPRQHRHLHIQKHKIRPLRQNGIQRCLPVSDFLNDLHRHLLFT